MNKRPVTTRKRGPRWTREQARAALAELTASGLTVAAFARKVGVHPQRLRSWRSRLGNVAEVGRMIERPEAAAVFIEVPHRVVKAIEVVLPGGVMLRVHECVDVEVLRRIAGALSEGPRC